MFVFLINLCDFMTGCYILGIAVKDFISGQRYTEIDLAWRSSIFCHGLAFTLLWSIILSAFFMLTVSISRYRVVTNPFKTPFNVSSIKFILICIPVSFLILLVIVFIVRHETEGLIYISSPICTLLGKTDDSISQKTVTISVSLYLLSVFAIIMLIYCYLLFLTNKSKGIINNTKSRQRQKQITRHVILVGITNVICWVPSSLFYLISVFVNEFPVFWLYFITLCVLPINSLINPILFNLSTLMRFLTHSKEIYLTKVNFMIYGHRAKYRRNN